MQLGEEVEQLCCHKKTLIKALETIAELPDKLESDNKNKARKLKTLLLDIKKQQFGIYTRKLLNQVQCDTEEDNLLACLTLANYEE
uniref:Uncharacterized protein n=1 Tax=Romanomermis culicivorax TaxID=13658 RepID=A0A915J3I3_ROMCU